MPQRRAPLCAQTTVSYIPDCFPCPSYTSTMKGTRVAQQRDSASPGHAHAASHSSCMPLLFFLRHLFPPLRHNLVHNPKFHRFLRGHEIVPFQRFFKPIQCSGPLFSRSSTMLSVDVGEGRTDTQDFFGMQSNIGCLALRTARWFYRDIQRLGPWKNPRDRRTVNHHTAVFQRISMSLFAAGQ